MRNIKALLANNYFYIRGGSERYLFCLMNLLTEKGHEVVPFSTANSANLYSPYAGFFADPFEPEKIKTISISKKLKIAGRILYSTEAKKRIKRLMDKTAPDIAHCHNIYGALSPSILGAFKQKGLPVILTVHDVKLLCPNHRMFIKHAICERCKPNRFYECAINKCIADSWAASFLGALEQYLHRISGIYRRNIDFFITPSEFFRTKLMEYGFPPDRIATIPNFLAAKDYEPKYERGRYAIFFGRLEETKGADILIDAAKQLKGALDFMIVGSGPLQTELEKKIAGEKVSNVRMTGQKSGKELIDLIRDAAFTVVPSRWCENNPYAIFESYACGKAVVGSNTGGIPELIEDNVTGLLFRPGDSGDLVAKIKMLASDPALAVEMGRRARQKVVDDYGPEKHYDRIMAVYRRFL